MGEMYEELLMEIVEFENEDIITESPMYPGEPDPVE